MKTEILGKQKEIMPENNQRETIGLPEEEKHRFSSLQRLSSRDHLRSVPSEAYQNNRKKRS